MIRRSKLHWSRIILAVLLLLVTCSLDASLPRQAPQAVVHHPRLFFAPDDIEVLQQRASSTHAEIWAAIQAYVDTQVDMAPPPAAPRNGSQDDYRNYGNQLIPFAFACVLTGQADYCTLTRTYLLTYARWQQWGEENKPGLGHAHMLMGNAIAYDWVYGYLTPDERELIRASLGKWTEQMYAASGEPDWDAWHNWWQRSYMQNFYWTTNGSLGVASLVLLNEDPRAATWLARASSKFARGGAFLEGMGDGTWHESLPYQAGMLAMALPFLVNLRQIQGTDLLPHTYLRNYLTWRLYNYLPGSLQFIMAYGDFEWSWLGASGHLLRFLAQEYDSGEAEWLAQAYNTTYGRKAGLWTARLFVFEFLFYDSAIAPLPPASLDKARVFPDLEGVIWRTGWEADDLVFALKAGTPGGRFAFDSFVQGRAPWEMPCSATGCQLNIDHDHHDTNTFYLYRAGQWLAPESEGVGKRDTSFHNTLLIDGEDQYAPPANRYGAHPEDSRGSDGFLEGTASTPAFDYVAADATRRYRTIDGLEDVTRQVLFVRPGYLLMLDNLAASSRHQYEWISHFGADVAVEDGWIRGAAGGGHMLGVAVVAPQPFATTTGDDGYPYVRVQPDEAVEDVRFIHLLYPADEQTWRTRPEPTLLGDNGQAAAVRVQSDGGSTDDILISYGQRGMRTTVGPYQSDGRAAVVARDGDDRLTRLLLVNGTVLADQGSRRVLIEHADGQGVIEVAYAGDTVTVHGAVAGEVRLYAPEARSLTVHGAAQGFRRAGEYVMFLR